MFLLGVLVGILISGGVGYALYRYVLRIEVRPILTTK